MKIEKKLRAHAIEDVADKNSASSDESSRTVRFDV